MYAPAATVHLVPRPDMSLRLKLSENSTPDGGGGGGGVPPSVPPSGTPESVPASGTPASVPASGTPASVPASGTPASVPASGTPASVPASGTPASGTPPSGAPPPPPIAVRAKSSNQVPAASVVRPAAPAEVIACAVLSVTVSLSTPLTVAVSLTGPAP